MSDVRCPPNGRGSILVGTLRFLEGINTAVGNVVCWLALGCAIGCFLVVLLRYAFGIGIVWLQELYVWQHALLFMLGAGPAYVHNEHVSVDLLTEGRDARTKAILNLVGLIFLLTPFLILVVVTSLPFAAVSWAIRETSGQMNGLPGLYLMKSSLLIFASLLAIQGVASIIRNILILKGNPSFQVEDPLSEGVE